MNPNILAIYLASAVCIYIVKSSQDEDETGASKLLTGSVYAHFFSPLVASCFIVFLFHNGALWLWDPTKTKLLLGPSPEQELGEPTHVGQTSSKEVKGLGVTLVNSPQKSPVTCCSCVFRQLETKCSKKKKKILQARPRQSSG